MRKLTLTSGVNLDTGDIIVIEGMPLRVFNSQGETFVYEQWPGARNRHERRRAAAVYRKEARS